jgi:hypothetical protein
MQNAFIDPLQFDDELALVANSKLIGRAPFHPVKGKLTEPTEDAFVLRHTTVSKYLAGFSRHSSRVFSNEAFRASRDVRTLGRGSLRRKKLSGS